MNNVNLVGRMVADTEVKRTTSGKSVCSFSLAVKRPFSNGVTDFIDCVAWDKNAETIAKYITKGKSIGITGILTVREFETKSGEKRKKVEISVTSFDFIGNKSDSGYSPRAEAPRFEEIKPSDDLPW